MRDPQALLILGPGEGKLHLTARLGRSRSDARGERGIRVDTTDKLTDPQIVAKV